MSLIFSTTPASQVPTAKNHATLEHVKEYLGMRKEQLEALVPALDVLQKEFFERTGTISSGDLARRQIQLIDSVLDSSEETFLINAENIFHRVELRVFHNDIESLLSTGKTVLPVELAEIPAYFKRKEDERLAEQARIKLEEKERLKAVAIAKIEAQKQLRRKRLAEELGISEEVITHGAH